MSNIKETTDLDFESNILNNGITVVDFSGSYCSPCKQLEPILEKLSNEFTSVNFIKVDVEESPKTSSKFSIRNVPTLVFFKDGVKINQITGVRPYADLKALILNL